MTKEERREYMKKYNAERGEKYKAKMKKYRTEHQEERREYMKRYNAEHKAKHMKWKAEHREEHNSNKRKYRSENLNRNGLTKHSIRLRSGQILKKCHSKLQGYEIHHCFGYEDPNKFIYIPKSLHFKIHQLLKDNQIPADSNHWNLIRELVNECNEYTYIRT